MKSGVSIIRLRGFDKDIDLFFLFLPKHIQERWLISQKLF